MFLYSNQNRVGFQSAPLTDVRGDLPSADAPATGEVFQSAPLTDVRGDPAARFTTRRNHHVSIRSPH